MSESPLSLPMDGYLALEACFCPPGQGCSVGVREEAGFACGHLPPQSGWEDAPGGWQPGHLLSQGSPGISVVSPWRGIPTTLVLGFRPSLLPWMQMSSLMRGLQKASRTIGREVCEVLLGRPGTREAHGACIQCEMPTQRTTSCGCGGMTYIVQESRHEVAAGPCPVLGLEPICPVQAWSLPPPS